MQASKEPPVLSLFSSPVYGPVQLKSVFCSYQEAYFLNSVWSSPLFPHSGVLHVYEIYPPSELLEWLDHWVLV